MSIDRRGFLRIAGTVFLTAGARSKAAAVATSSPRVTFPQGVASGDPLPHAVLLWTRARPEDDAQERLPLVVQLSDSEGFDTVLVEAAIEAQASNDFTVRAHIDGLEPGRHYHYRFLAVAGGMSRTGRTMTAPAPGDGRPVQLAFVSCQNYEQGYYGAWARMLSDDLRRPVDQQIQFVLHLGDFIYERYSNRASRGQRYVRQLPAFPDGVSDGERIWAHSLADYRHLYKTYLEDPHLQAARARWPFVCTWDDHEFSNDGFQHFSFYGDEPLAEPGRLRNAHRAWFEYIPALVQAPDPQLRIYRSLRWGQLSEVLLTDLRSYRSPPPVPQALVDDLELPLKTIALVDIMDGGRDYAAGNPPQTLPFGDGAHPNPALDRDPGTLLGETQKAWFKERLASTDARWKIWANSLPIVPFRLDLSAIPFGGMQDSVLGTDAWNGYPGEYRELMNYLDSEGVSGLVSLSGDHHMQAAGTLVGDPDREDTAALAVDFNVTGISSTPHFLSVLHSAQQDQGGFMQLVAREEDGALLPNWDLTLQQGVLSALAFDKTGSATLANWLGPNRLNPGLAYIDTNTNGYGLARFDQQDCKVELVTIEPPLAEPGPAGSQVLRRVQFELALWNAGDEPELLRVDLA